MKNKRAKQMICDVMNQKNSNLHNKREYAFVDSKLVFWINRVGRYTLNGRYSSVSLTGNQLKGSC